LSFGFLTFVFLSFVIGLSPTTNRFVCCVVVECRSSYSIGEGNESVWCAELYCEKTTRHLDCAYRSDRYSQLPLSQMRNYFAKDSSARFLVAGGKRFVVLGSWSVVLGVLLIANR
jgi:hypothetical protein